MPRWAVGIVISFPSWSKIGAPLGSLFTRFTPGQKGHTVFHLVDVRPIVVDRLVSEAALRGADASGYCADPVGVLRRDGREAQRRVRLVCAAWRPVPVVRVSLITGKACEYLFTG